MTSTTPEESRKKLEVRFDNSATDRPSIGKLRKRRSSRWYKLWEEGMVSDNDDMIINQEKWLPLEVNQNSISALLKYLTLEDYFTVKPLDETLSKPIRICHGLVCSSSHPIEEFEAGPVTPLPSSYLEEKSLYSKNIANANITLDLLNIWLCSKQTEGSGQDEEETKMCSLEKYLMELFGKGSTLDLTNHLNVSVPIAFAHNSVARENMFTADLVKRLSGSSHHSNKENQMNLRKHYIYCFVISTPNGSGIGDTLESQKSTQQPTSLFYINKAADLVKVNESEQNCVNEAVQEFLEYLKAKVKGRQTLEMFAIIGNDLSRLAKEMEMEERKLAKLVSKDTTKTSSTVAAAQSRHSMDSRNSLTYQELNELSALSDKLDEAEDFQLTVQGQNDKSSPKKLNDSSNNPNSKLIRVSEKRIRKLAKEIALIREETEEKSHTNTSSNTEAEEQKRAEEKHEDLYSSRAYLQFASFYREKVLGFESDQQDEIGSVAEESAKPAKEPERRRSKRVIQKPVTAQKSKKKKKVVQN